MTFSMRKMSAGKGYEYLLRSVVAGDGNRALTTPLTGYYAEAGTPPGRWIGTGLAEFGGGQVVEVVVVTPMNTSRSGARERSRPHHGRSGRA